MFALYDANKSIFELRIGLTSFAVSSVSSTKVLNEFGIVKLERLSCDV